MRFPLSIFTILVFLRVVAVSEEKVEKLAEADESTVLSLWIPEFVDNDFNNVFHSCWEFVVIEWRICFDISVVKNNKYCLIEIFFYFIAVREKTIQSKFELFMLEKLLTL